MNIHSRRISLSAVLLFAILVAHTGLAADDPKPYKNLSEMLSVEEIQNLLDNLPANDKRQLADSAHSTMVFSYLARADETALANARWLLMLHPEQADDDLRQAKAIIAELHRRKVKGTFGMKPEEKLPAGFGSWAATAKLSFLIDALDEVDNRNLPTTTLEYPSGRDWRIEALIGVGDAAVPALIDTIERDERLTRLREPDPNRFTFSWKIFRVRDTAMHALVAILRVRYFDPTQDGTSSNLGDKEKIQKVVAQLRAYWRANSNLAFGERMMKVLTNPNASDEACREAAHNLASSGEDYVYGPLGIEIRTADKPPTDLAKFQNPTVGEAILAVLDRVSANRGERPDKVPVGFVFRHIEADVAYLEPLVELHDKRLLPEFLRRYKSASTLHRRMVWAVAANATGDAGPIKELADEFREGTLIISREERGNKARSGDVSKSDLMSLVGCLTRIDLPETSRALFAAADPKHPLHHRIAREIATIPPWQSPAFGEVCLDHPYCLAFLRHDLDDHTPTGGVYRIGGSYSAPSSLTYGMPGVSTISEIPDFLRDPATRRESAPELVCDRAAALIDEIVAGMPVVHVHPLRKDYDQRLKEMISLVDRFHGRFRRITSVEDRWVSWGVPFIADIALGGKAATADDVKAGRAIFSLGGAGKPASTKLPMAAMLKPSQKGASPEPVLLLQAEVDADGKTVYGIIGRRFMRAATSDELADVKPIEPSEHLSTFRHAQ